MQSHLGLMYLDDIGSTEYTGMTPFWPCEAADNGFDRVTATREHMLSNNNMWIVESFDWTHCERSTLRDYPTGPPFSSRRKADFAQIY